MLTTLGIFICVNAIVLFSWLACFMYYLAYHTDTEEEEEDDPDN